MKHFTIFFLLISLLASCSQIKNKIDDSLNPSKSYKTDQVAKEKSKQDNKKSYTIEQKSNQEKQIQETPLEDSNKISNQDLSQESKSSKNKQQKKETQSFKEPQKINISKSNNYKPAQSGQLKKEKPETPDKSEKDNIIFNFDEADLQEIIRTMADILGINYIADVPIKGRVTIHTSGSLNKGDILPIFYQILEINIKQ